MLDNNNNNCFLDYFSGTINDRERERDDIRKNNQLKHLEFKRTKDNFD